MGSQVATTRLSYRWILWYHDPEDKDYSIGSYVRISDINTPQQFWSVIDSIPKEAWECGMFFFMKFGYPPIWEAEENKQGGSWSKKISRDVVYETFVHLMANCISNEILVERKETLVGVTVSHKGPDSIVRIWNSTTQVCRRIYLKRNIPHFQITEDVSYTNNADRDTSNNSSYRSNNSRRGRK
jgi:hypothetical protein